MIKLPDDVMKSVEAVAKLNNDLYRWTSRMSYNESWVGESEGLIKGHIREMEKILDSIRAKVQRLNATAQHVSDGWVSVPRSLTAENGAKAALLGEFSLQQNITCHECFGEGCDDCNGQGHWISSIPVDWTTIKEIWAKGVEHFSPAVPGGQDD